MERRRASKGQILAIILLLILGFIIISGLISIFSGRNGSAPVVKEAYWQIDGQKASTSSLGQEVEAHVVVQATEQYVGSIVVKIRKDARLWFDSDFKVDTIPVDLAGGDEKSIELSFTPDETSHGTVTGLRGYFIEVEFRATRTTYTMENSYPPRLTVTT
jgi:hypothetical protein